MKKYIYIFLGLTIWGCGNPEPAEKPFDYPISAVDIKNVVLIDDFWLPKISTIQDSTIHYAFEKCVEEGRMDNFLIAGKKMAGKTRGQMPFDDTDVYKIIEGASNTLISKPNPALDAYLDSIIAIIKVGQEPDGYLTTWFTIDRKNPPAPWVKPAEKRWEQEISSHELYNSGHLFEAAATHYIATGKRNFLDIALKNADLLVDNFGPGKLSMPPGHQIVETGLIKLYRITQNEKYLSLAKFFLDIRGDSTTHPLFGDYSQDHLPVTQQNEAVGHAVRAMYMYAAMTDIAALYHDAAYLAAVRSLWHNMVEKKTYLTGGIGAKHEGEAFGGNYELPNLTAYNETCAAIGSVYWNQRLFLLTGESKHYDVIERTLYNGLIAGISVDGKKFFYPNPLESDGKYNFNQGACTRSSWFNCSCCPTNMIRFIPSIPGLIYATNPDELYVNLYISNQAKVEINNQSVELIQQTDYPWNGTVTLSVNPAEKTSFTLKLRVPGWAQNQVIPGGLYSYMNRMDQRIQLSVNGKAEPVHVTNGYIDISREWSKGDKIEIILPMAVRKVIADENIAEDLQKVAFEYGPIVYCGEETDNPQLAELKISDMDSFAVGQMNHFSSQVNIVKGDISGQPITLIPYYLWSNRGVNKMKVWFPAI
ncbi:MAG: glycoside hydrolase family 127 protein [Bacteroidia bacterium]